MIKKNKLFALLATLLFSCSNLFAQEPAIDLTSQRSESQQVLKIPEQVIDHHGIVINPTPHQLLVQEGVRANFSKGFSVKDKQRKFASDFNFIKTERKGAKLTIDFGAKIATKYEIKTVSGAYALNINSKGITIIGYDERGAFYGIQTLRQIMEKAATKDGLPCLSVNDYPDLPIRGVVEGFYGTPWSHQVRLSLIDFYGKFKMNSYIYGPKDDPYHSCPNWRLPYPEKEAKNIKELVEACNRNRVDFVWAIHPGQDIKWNEEDYNNLVCKFNWMYDLGIRAFAIFFDDISGEGTNPEKQVELLNRLNKEFVMAKGDVGSLIICPTDYSKLWANPTPQGSLSIYGQKLDPSVKVFWTGDVVCSDLTKETLDWINSRTKRPSLYWWNFPVTDYVRNIILQGPVYGLEKTLTANDLCGLVSNPMEHGEASKLSLYGVTDYTWNIANYNPIDNWNRGIAEITPEAKEAYRTFAIHSADTETGYRRDESWETETFRINNYTDSQYQTLYNEFEKISKVPEMMENHCTNKILMNELHPWLVEFGKLGIRGTKALELIKLYQSADNGEFWTRYTQNLMDSTQRKQYQGHKSGTMKLQPFYENTMDDLLAAFYTKVTGKQSTVCKAISSFSSIHSIASKLMFDNDTTTYYTSGTSQKEGDWIGVDLGSTRDVSEVSILQGRNSKNDVDYFDNAIVEYSMDGRKWTPLTSELKKQYDIQWKGAPIKAQYIILKRLISKKTNYVSVRSFEVNPIRREKIGFSIEAAAPTKAMYAFDGNPETSYFNSGSLTFGVTKGTKLYTILMKFNATNSAVNLRQLTSKGKLISETAINTPFYKINLAKDATKVQIKGDVEIFEIIPE